MSKYTGKKVTVAKSAAEIADRFSDLTRLQSVLDMVPEDQKDKLKDVTFETDSININTPQLGAVKLKVAERNDRRIKFAAVGTPVPLEMVVDMDEATPGNTDLTASIDVQLPMMLRPLVAPHLNKAVDMLGDLIGHIARQ